MVLSKSELRPGRCVALLCCSNEVLLSFVQILDSVRPLDMKPALDRVCTLIVGWCKLRHWVKGGMKFRWWWTARRAVLSFLWMENRLGPICVSYINRIMPCPRCAHSLAPLFMKGRNQAELLVFVRFATTRVKAGWSLVKEQAGLTWENPFWELLSPAPYFKLGSLQILDGGMRPVIIVACRCAVPAACLRQIAFGYQTRRLPTFCFLGGLQIM